MNKREKVNDLIENSGIHEIIFECFNKMSAQIPNASRVEYFDVDDFIDDVIVPKLLNLSLSTIDRLNQMFSLPDNKNAFLEFNNVLDFSNQSDILKMQSILLRPSKQGNS